MISVNVKTNHVRETVTVIPDETPMSIFDTFGIDVSTSMVSLRGAPLTGGDLHRSFEALGVEDGASVTLSAIVKAEGARS